MALAASGARAAHTRVGDAGWRLLRTDFTWSRIEPAPGAFDFAACDALVDAAATA